MEKKTLVIASNNSSKVKEILTNIGTDIFEVKSLKDANIEMEVEELGNTYEENAHLKANAVFQSSNLNVLADDSGLEVEALGGKPGIHSARFAPSDNSLDNVSYLLNLMQGVENRKARFVCSFILIYAGKSYSFRGEVEGNITHCPKGNFGFAYDTVFVPKDGNQTFAEMLPVEKDAISHRGLALQKLNKWIAEKKQSGLLG